jgi:ABC transporter family protein
MATGAGLVTGMLLLAVALAGGLAMAPPDTGPSWSIPFNLALTGLQVVAPLCAGAVAWLVRDYRVRGIGELAASSNRGGAGGAVPRVAAACAWAVLAYLVLLTVATLRTSHRGPPTGPPLLLALLAGCFLAACAALGWATGTLADVRAAGPLLALALFGLVQVGAAGDGWARPLAPVDPEATYRPFLQPHVGLVWVRVVVLAAVADCLLVTDLTELRDRPVRTLNYGMRQRMLLAQALVNRPSLVVLDAPTVMLDPQQRSRFLARVVALRGRCAVVLATPLVESVATVCDEVVVLAAGRTVFSGTTAELAGGTGDLAAGYRRVLASTVVG